MTIHLSESMQAYVTRRVEDGCYGSDSEFVVELIRKEQEAERIQRLRAMVQAGLDSGPGRPDTQADWDELDAIARGDIDGPSE